jgi:bifunctional oligoribonuclease and PAP phosphatase NrnA
VKILHVDPVPKRYLFMQTASIIEIFQPQRGDLDLDLVLVFDTNDERLIEPLTQQLKKQKIRTIYVDHHPLLKQGPRPQDFYIDLQAASTGEVVYHLIKALKIPLDVNSAKALYASIAFDTQLFRYVKNSERTHMITAELLKHSFDSLLIHRHLFGRQTPQKVAFIASALSQIEYRHGGRLAILKVDDQELERFGLDLEDARDLVDMVMNIDVVEAAVLFRQDGPNQFKLSIRSNGDFEVQSVAEVFGGGGHDFASGAYITGVYSEIKEKLITELSRRILGSYGKP